MLKNGLLAVCLSITLLAAANLPVQARGGYRCDVCNTGTVTVISRTVTFYDVDHMEICPKTNYDFDYIYLRKWVEHEVCDACGVEYYPEYSSYERVCNH